MVNDDKQPKGNEKQGNKEVTEYNGLNPFFDKMLRNSTRKSLIWRKYAIVGDGGIEGIYKDAPDWAKEEYNIWLALKEAKIN